MADDSNVTPPPPPADAPKSPPNSAVKGADVDSDKGISVAKGGGTDALGDQVHPDTQTSEKDGHRTLVKPVTDLGPYLPAGAPNVIPPDRSKGEHRYSDSNDTFSVKMRTSTGHDEGYGKPGGEVVKSVELAPEIAVSGAASDCYHPSKGDEKSLTADAVAKAGEGREAAPLHE